jgi:hypothetical protein
VLKKSVLSRGRKGLGAKVIKRMFFYTRTETSGKRCSFFFAHEVLFYEMILSALEELIQNRSFHVIYMIGD